MQEENEMQSEPSSNMNFPLGCARGASTAGEARWVCREADMGPKAPQFTFAEYQDLSKATATYPDRSGPLGLAYIISGLAAEAGEVAGKIAKGLRDADGIFDPDRRAEIEKEIGDNLWFLAELCTHFGISLENAARGNVAKLQDRMSRGVLGGSGDNR